MTLQERVMEAAKLRLRFQMNGRLRLESLAALSKVFREFGEPIREELLGSMVFAVPEELLGPADPQAHFSIEQGELRAAPATPKNPHAYPTPATPGNPPPAYPTPATPGGKPPAHPTPATPGGKPPAYPVPATPGNPPRSPAPSGSQLKRPHGRGSKM